MYEYPGTAFVANFLGQSNLLPVEVDGSAGDEIAVRGEAGRFGLPRDRCRVTSGSAPRAPYRPGTWRCAAW